MKFKHIRDRERGYERRIEELTEALEFIALAIEAGWCQADDHKAVGRMMEVIENKCSRVLKTCGEALDKQ